MSVSNKRLHDAMLVEETSTFLNDTFVAQLVMPDLSFAEVYTDTEPILQQAKLRGHRTVEPLSLKSGWDFLLPSHRQLALASLRRSRPYMAVIAFPCAPWSPLQQLNAEPGKLQNKRKEARVLVDFAVEVARLLLSNGCHFIIENPDPSLAWRLRSLRLADEPQVMAVRLDQCRFGLRPASGVRLQVPAGASTSAARHRKRTRFLTSSQSVVSTFLDKMCQGQNLKHYHVPVMGGGKVTTKAGHYPLQLTKAILLATEKQFDYETSCSWRVARSKMHEVNAVDGDAEDDGAGVDFHMEASDDEEAPVQPGESKVVIPNSVRQAVRRLRENTPCEVGACLAGVWCTHGGGSGGQAVTVRSFSRAAAAKDEATSSTSCPPRRRRTGAHRSCCHRGRAASRALCRACGGRCFTLSGSRGCGGQEHGQRMPISSTSLATTHGPPKSYDSRPGQGICQCRVHGVP